MPNCKTEKKKKTTAQKRAIKMGHEKHTKFTIITNSKRLKTRMAIQSERVTKRQSIVRRGKPAHAQRGVCILAFSLYLPPAT